MGWVYVLISRYGCSLYVLYTCTKVLTSISPSFVLCRYSDILYIYRCVLHPCAARQSHLNPTPTPHGGTLHIGGATMLPARLPARMHAVDHLCTQIPPPTHTYMQTHKAGCCHTLHT